MDSLLKTLEKAYNKENQNAENLNRAMKNLNRAMKNKTACDTDETTVRNLEEKKEAIGKKLGNSKKKTNKLLCEIASIKFCLNEDPHDGQYVNHHLGRAVSVPCVI